MPLEWAVEVVGKPYWAVAKNIGVVSEQVSHSIVCLSTLLFNLMIALSMAPEKAIGVSPDLMEMFGNFSLSESVARAEISNADVYGL